MHGRNNLDKAIDLLDNENKEDFRKFVNKKFHLIHIICLFVNQKNF